MQRAASNLEPQKPMSAKGVLGRVCDALRGGKTTYKTALYSVSGNEKILEGKQTPDIIDKDIGIERFRDYNAIHDSTWDFVVRLFVL